LRANAERDGGIVNRLGGLEIGNHLDLLVGLRGALLASRLALLTRAARRLAGVALLTRAARRLVGANGTVASGLRLRLLRVER